MPPDEDSLRQRRNTQHMAWELYKADKLRKRPAFYLGKSSIRINHSANEALKLQANNVTRVTLRYDREANLIRFDFHKKKQPDSVALTKLPNRFDSKRPTLQINAGKFFETMGISFDRTYRCTNFKRVKDYVVLDMNDRDIVVEGEED